MVTAEVPPLALRAVHAAQDVLGASMRAAYLHGSAVQGGLKPRSDVDVLVVINRPTTHAERRRLVEKLLRMSGRHAVDGPQRPLEVTVVRDTDVRPWRYPPTQQLQYGEWLREQFEAGSMPEPEASGDLAVVLAQVRAHGVALHGPPASALLDPVPRGDLVRAGREAVDDLIADLAEDSTNVVLTFARIWLTAETGQIGSKDAAAGWALRRLPPEHHAVLEHARAVYLGGDEDWRAMRDRLPAHVEYVVGRLLG